MKVPRNSARHRRRYKVTLAHHTAFTSDVSATGFCAELRGQVLPKGTPVTGSIQVRDQAIPFSGYVAWTRQGDWHLNVHGRMGIRFTQIPAGFAELVEASAKEPVGRPK